MRNHGLGTLSTGLLWLTAISYVVLVALTLSRALWFPAALRSDFTYPRRGFGFFTFVAGTDLLGTRLALAGHRHIAMALLVVG